MFDLRNFKKEFGLTQMDIATLFECGQSNVSDIENQKRGLTPEQKSILIDKYGVEVFNKYSLQSENQKAQDKIGDNSKTTLLLPISAQGGTLNDFVVSVKGTDCETIISPIKDVDFAIPIAGDSMAPEYPSGSQVLIKKINEKAFIDWGKVFVLDTCNGVIIKRIYPTEKEGVVKCVSINPSYPPFEVSLKDVFGVYRVLMCMSMK